MAKLTKRQLLEFKSPKSQKYIMKLFGGDAWEAHHETSRLISLNILVINSDHSYILKECKEGYEQFIRFRTEKLKSISVRHMKKYKERWRFGAKSNRTECKITEKLVKEMDILDKQANLLWNTIDLTPSEFFANIAEAYKIK